MFRNAQCVKQGRVVEESGVQPRPGADARVLDDDGNVGLDDRGVVQLFSGRLDGARLVDQRVDDRAGRDR